jgi:putative transcriptional regulator
MNLTNHFIIAMPDLKDPMFEKTVNFICQHTEQGAMGLTINRPTNITVSEFLSQLDIPLVNKSLASQPIYLGGPVETGHGFILHSNDFDSPHSNSEVNSANEKEADTKRTFAQTLKINDDISISSSLDILHAIANGNGPSEFLITLGYSGWGSNQIENEMKQNSWLNVPADNDIIFQTPSDKRWESAAMKLGINIHLISCDIGHA